MASKMEFYAQLANQTAVMVSGNYGSWTAFLETAARLYKYPYHEQLMIYAQRPDATACAEYDLWNRRMNRYVRRGSKGIALIDNSGEKPRIKYVFDVADTGEMEHSRTPYLWNYRPEHEPAVSTTLEQAYSISASEGFGEQLNQIASVLVTQYWLEHQQDILRIVDGSYLERYYDYDKGVAFLNAATVSTAYTLMTRCGLETPFGYEDFRPVLDFNTPDAVAALGCAVSQISETVLRQIEATIKQYEREKITERSQNHERTDLQQERGLLRSQPDPVPARGEAPGQVRPDAESISSGAPSGAVEQPDPVGEIVFPSVGDRGNSEPAVGADDAETDAGGRRDGTAESDKSYEMGGADEYPESTGRGNDSGRADLQLTEKPPLSGEQFSFFLSEAEQIQYIAEAERAGVAPSAFSMPQETIDHFLRLGSNTDNHRTRILLEYAKQQPTEKLVAFLQKTYHGGNGLQIDGSKVAAWYGEDGIRLAYGSGARYARNAQVLPWEAVAQRIGELLEQGQFATNVEIAESRSFERKQLSEQLWYMAGDMRMDTADAGYMSAVRSLRGGFPEETQQIAAMLASPQEYAAILEQLYTFRDAWQENNDLMRFRFYNPQKLIAPMEDYARPRRDYFSSMAEVPSVPGFITEDEINEALAGGSHVEGSKARIYDFYQKSPSAKEQADFLKREYGIGGGNCALSHCFYSDESHDSKGIHYKKPNCYDVELSWPKVAKTIDTLIHSGRFYSPEQLARKEALEAEKAAKNTEAIPESEVPIPEEPEQTEESSSIWDYNPIKEAHPEDIVLYQVGDFFEIHGEDAEKTAPLLNLTLTTRPIPTGGRMDMCGIPAHTLEQSVEKLRQQFPVTIAAVGENGERIPYSLQIIPRRYLVTAYHHIENGFDDKLDYHTLEEAEKAAQGYVDGTMESDGFAYEGAAIYDLQEQKWLRIYGDFLDPKAQEQVFPSKSISWELEKVEDLPYKVGDSVYLDNTVFEITEIGRSDVQLRDPTHLYPIFRSESKERLLQLMQHDDRNRVILDSVEPMPSAPTMEEAIDQNPISIQVGGQWQTFPSTAAAEEAMYADFKAATHRNARNFRITDDNLGVGGAKAKFEANINAIRLLKSLEAEDMQASPEQQEVLSRYVGWGGVPDAFDSEKSAWKKEYQQLKELLTPEEYEAARASTLNAHYTSPTVIRAIYEAVEHMGFRTGNILEPSMGVGNFFGMLPDSMENSRLYGVELDSITGRIAKQLYPKANITVAGFETTDRRDFFDIAIGNVPFGQYKVNDPAYNKLGFNIHNYFFAKALDQVRPGGVVAFVTSRYTMDAKNPDVRKYLAQRADLLGAIRLPNDAFQANAGTEVVSDIIFLQKRDRPIQIELAWVHLGKTEDGYAINSYFLEHPEMVMGINSSKSTAHGMDYTVEPLPDIPLADQLSQAVQHIQGTYREAELPELGEGEEIRTTLPADPDVKNYSYTVVDGQVYYRENSIMVKPDLNATALERVKGMVQLKNCVNNLIAAQMDEQVPDAKVQEYQVELNQLYDSYTTKYGILNNRANRLAFSDDSAYYLLCALEILDDEGNFLRKADMFTKRTIQPHRAVTSVDTASEALTLSIAEKACVDLGYMASLMGGSEKIPQIVADLKGVIYKDPNTGPFDWDTEGSSWEQGWQTSDQYLSGNVRQKLREAQQAAGVDPFFAGNVEALQAAQPKDLEAHEIEVRLGATWIDKSYIKQFMVETLDTPFYLQRILDVQYSPYTAAWNISNKSKISYNDVAAFSTYGTQRVSAYEILEDSLNLRDVRVYDTIEDRDGNKKRVLNAKETTLAQQKQQVLREAFRDWIWADPHRRETLVKQYNEEMNSIRPREYDGRHIAFAGMNPEISLREHQRNAIAHVLYGGNTLLAHEVGAGKTFEMVAAAMESKRLGLCRKSIFVVPNHLTEQWASEFLRLYPSANILVTKQRDFETANRKKFCARIATGDYDAVIIGHSQFEKIPISKARQEQQLQDQIAEITMGISEMKYNRGEKFSVKELERTKRGLESRLEKLRADTRKDDVITFEELGVDRLFVDEAHNYKNLFLYTKMQNVAGLSTSDAQKSSDMFAKCRYMDELTGSRGVIFATGTPVSNSMTELYTMQRYLQYSRLEEMGMTHFDCWASRFGETVTALELAPEGKGYRPRTRFSRFFNLPELMNLFKEVADIKTADQLHLPVPEVEYHNITAKPSEVQQQLVQELSERAAAIHTGNVSPEQDNMLKVTSDGRKLGLDQRLINPLFPDEPESKVSLCVDNIVQVWKDGEADKLTQLVFCDISTPQAKGKAISEDGTEKSTAPFTVYDDIRTKLIANGIPPEQIAFIHDANTDVKKKELFGKVRSGQVRILLGSTAKMGAGTNVQDKLVAIHDLDCPWRPGDLAQRKGRIERQGNQNEKVHVFRYVTEGTFDAYLWQTVENKQKFISQIMTSKSPVRSCDDVDETALSFAEIKALCAGDPRIKERMDLDVDVSRLKIMKADYKSKQYRLEDNLLRNYPEQIQAITSQQSALKADAKMLLEYPIPEEGFVGMTILGQEYQEKEAAGAALIEAAKRATGLEPVAIGQYRGLALSVTLEDFGKKYVLTMQGAVKHQATLGSDPKGNLIRMENALGQIPARYNDLQAKLEEIHHQQEAARVELEKPFPFEEELREKTARLIFLDAELNLDGGSKEPICEEAPAKPARPSVLDKLKVEPIPGSADRKQKLHQEERS